MRIVGVMSAGPALHTDHYELTMLDAALGSGVASHRAVFEVFTRRLPPGRGYGVLAGTGRLATILSRFTFGSDDLAVLEAQAQFSPRLIDHLAGLRVEGRIDGHRDGEIYMPNEPVLVVETSFGTGLLLETLVLSVLNHDSAVASAAARMHDAAGGRTLLEMGGRRTHEEAAVAAARAAWLVGFDATSNLAAGARHGVPTAGTAAHAFTLAHPTEAAAFAAQIEAMGAATTLLVDTYDIDDAIDDAVAVAEQLGAPPGGIRIDSGDLAAEAARARARLDTRGAGSTRIVVSGDLDEYRMAELAAAPVDGYGVGTALVTGSGHPTAGFVYKLVAVARRPGADAPLEPVFKTSEGKRTRGGRVHPHRVLEAGRAVCDVLSPDPTPPPGGRPLHVPVMVDASVAYPFTLAEDRTWHQQARAELPDEGRSLHAEGPALVVELLGGAVPSA
jgi:nicotinate phosphoribosyltransferase